MIFFKEAAAGISILFGVLAVIALFMGGFVPIFAIAFGIVSVYYLCIYIALKSASKTDHKSSKLVAYACYLLFVIPIVWVIFDMEGFLNFLLQGIKLDMR